MNLRALPFFRLLLPFMLGIALADAFGTARLSDLYLTLLIGIALILIGLRKQAYRYRWLFGLIAHVFLVAGGYTITTWLPDTVATNHFSKSEQLPACFAGIISQAPGKGGRLKLVIRLEASGQDLNAMRPASGTVLVLLKPDSSSYTLRYGDRVAIRAAVQPTSGPKNPHAFDYRRYLHHQNIHFQAFADADALIRLSEGHGNGFWTLAYRYRDRLLTLLHRYFPTPGEHAVAAALLVGYQEELPDELREAYIDTGSMHALAVSGTHVGLLYTGLYFLLGRLPWRGRFGRWAETLLILVAIWAFTLITGATGSVVRASAMFSLYLSGRLLFRAASIWNVLAASAFLMLLAYPYRLYDAGWQLSYTAVMGMVFFYPRLYRASPLLPKWVDEGWKILLVGLAAQLGTLPLALYYFHQFPMYFWLAGWAVVLGGAIFLWAGAMLIVLDLFWPFAAHWMGTALYYMVWGMNWIIQAIQSLPLSVWSCIWLPGWAAGALALVIVLGAIAWAKRKAYWLLAALTVLMLLGMVRIVRSLNRIHQKEIIVYYVSKGSLIDIMDGTRAWALGDSLSRRQLSFSATNHRWASGVDIQLETNLSADTSFTADNIFYKKPILQFYQFRIAVLDAVVETDGVPSPVDVLMVCKNPELDPATCLTQFPAKTVVLDASNNYRQVEKWKTVCSGLSIPCHDVREQGAWQYHPQ